MFSPVFSAVMEKHRQLQSAPVSCSSPSCSSTFSSSAATPPSSSASSRQVGNPSQGLLLADSEDVDFIMELAENYGLAKAMAAGAAAGVMEHLWMFPVDTIKTRMQTHFIPGQKLYHSVPNAILQVIFPTAASKFTSRKFLVLCI